MISATRLLFCCLGLAGLFVMGMSRPQQEEPGTVSCTVNVVQNTHTCQDITGVVFHSGPLAGQSLVSLTLDPEFTGWVAARIDATYTQIYSGVTLALGNWEANDGGPAGPVELQIANDALLTYTLSRDASGYSHEVGGMVIPNGVLTFQLANGRLEVDNHAGTAGYLEAPEFAALAEPSSQDSAHYDLFLAINRAVLVQGQEGTGVREVVITLFATQPPPLTEQRLPTIRGSIGAAPQVRDVGRQLLSYEEATGYETADWLPAGGLVFLLALIVLATLLERRRRAG